MDVHNYFTARRMAEKILINSIDIFNKIDEIYKDKDIIFKIIKHDGSIKFLRKKNFF